MNCATTRISLTRCTALTLRDVHPRMSQNEYQRIDPAAR
jgi:hypothetical protein